jgi:hypothetical protein
MHSRYLACTLGVVALLSTTAVSGQVVINEVLFDPIGVNFGGQIVEIRNQGASPEAVGGFWLYFAPARWQFPADAAPIPPGETIRVHVNSHGVATVSDYFTGIAGMRNLNQKDAVAVYSTNVFTNPAVLVDFVQWGGASNAGEDVAAAAGQWTVGTFVNVEALRDGSSIAYDGSGFTPGDWCVDGTPTLGATNDSCTTSFVESPVIINEIGYVRTGPGAYHPAIELRNAGSVLEDLGGKWVNLANEHFYQFPSGSSTTTIGPGEVLVLHLGVSGNDDTLDFYTGAGTFREFRNSDSVSLHSLQPFTDPTSMIDFVQWGTVAGPLEDTAVAAELWGDGQLVAIGDRLPRGSIAAQGAGVGVAKWAVDNTGTIGLPNDTPPEPPVVISEVLVDPEGTSTGQGAIEIRNVLAGETIDVSGFTIVTEKATVPGMALAYTFPTPRTIGPDGFLIIRVNRAGLPSPTTIFTGPYQELNPAAGSLLLFATPQITDPNNLVDYLRWGGGSGYGQTLASLVGIWPSPVNATIGIDTVRDNSSFAYVGGPGDTIDRPEGWRVDWTPSLGDGNGEPVRFLPFQRGDCNDDGQVNITDGINLLGVLFLGSRHPLCDDACDANDSNELDISDPIFVLNYLFQGGIPLPPPRVEDGCGADSATGANLLSCSAYTACGF